MAYCAVMNLPWAGKWALMAAAICSGGVLAADASPAQALSREASPANNELWARTNWWAFQPAIRPAVPHAGSSSARAPQNPIDNFVTAKLVELKLHPSPEADNAHSFGGSASI